MKKECVAKQYTIEVDLLSIMNSDNLKEENHKWDDILCTQLDSIQGVDNIDYNGHFGNFVWVTIETEYDTNKTWDQIEKFITKAME